MKTLYLECNMGAAGDMLMAALFEICPNQQAFLQQINHLGLPEITVEAVPTQKCGITGTQMRVLVRGQEEAAEAAACHHDHDHNHHHDHDHDHDHDHNHSHNHDHCHYSYADICERIEQLDLPQTVKKDAAAVYRLIGDAESHAHGAPIEQIHFHEVGSLDAVADVVGCCLLFHLIDADQVIVSPVHVGYGTVRCAHGVLPVPAPATAHILQGVPIYGGQVMGELCTPTGAALLRHFASRFGGMPQMAVSGIGYGMGSKVFETANCIRAFLGETSHTQEEVVELCCNLDDITSEALGFAAELLLENGALDVFTTPIYMKKNRPAHLLTCLCKPQEQEKFTRLMLLHTTTLGVRSRLCKRETLEHQISTVKTAFGPVRVKIASGHGIHRIKPEYEDLKKIAAEQDLSMAEVCRLVESALRNEI